jgi:hypothetical protein
MSAFLWTILILGIVEVAVAIAYWTVGRVPERTVGGSLINGAIWTGFACWAGYLLANGATQ